MIRFLFKGVMRDKNRSVLPIAVISIGVFLTVLLSSWISGVFNDMIDVNANFTTGHVKVMTRAYAENEAQKPIDLSLLGVDELIVELNTDYPDMEWVKRIQFGGLLDVADENGETRAQGTAVGQAVDFFSADSKEVERMNISKSIINGALPEKPGEALISHDFAERFEVNIGDQVTLFGSTMEGSMAFTNFTVAGTVRFGLQALDRGAILMDVTDAQMALDMENGACEILGYAKNGIYDMERAEQVKTSFNAKYADDPDEFAPKMVQLRDQAGLAEYLDMGDYMSGVMAFIFIFAMSIVLWNTGLLGGLRRYTEFGIRLAMGEEKKHIYRTLIYEAIVIGIIGSIVGTILGLGASYYLQEHGITMSAGLQGSGMMLPSTFRAQIAPQAFYIGFIPGLFSMVLGNALSGIGIYKRKTAQLFKELGV